MSGRISEHGELVFDVMRYATRMLAAGDESGLLLMGFTPKQIRALEELTLKSLQRVGELGSHFLDFRIDAVCFERVLRRIEREREDEELKDELLRAGAPIRLMHHFWGMTSRDCAERRRVLGIEAPVGRPAQADDAALERLWHLWQETSALADERRRYLELARRSELPLSVIWLAVEDWKGESATGAVRGDAGYENRAQAEGAPAASAGRSASDARRVVDLHR